MSIIKGIKKVHFRVAKMDFFYALNAIEYEFNTLYPAPQETVTVFRIQSEYNSQL